MMHLIAIGRALKPRRIAVSLGVLAMAGCTAAVASPAPLAPIQNARKKDVPSTARSAESARPLSKFGDKAAKRGIYFSLLSIQELFHQSRGGIPNNNRTRAGGQTDLSTMFDLHRLFGWDNGGMVKLTIDYQNGTLGQFVNENTGASLMGSGIQGPGVGLENTYRVTELSYSNYLFNHKMWWLIGRTQATFFFNLQPYTLGFENTNIDVGLLPQVLNTGFVFYPESTWGALAQFATSKNSYFRIGAYENNSNAADRDRHDVELSFKDSTGVFVPMQFGVNTTIGSLPGFYDVGAYYSSTNVQVPGADPDRSNRGQTGVWLQGIQHVWTPAAATDRGLQVFGGASWATGGRYHFVDNEYDVGALWTGIFARRPQDQLGFVATDTKWGGALMSFRDARFPSDIGLSDHTYEYELYYALNLGSGVTLRPFVQRWVHPDQVFTEAFDHNTVASAATVVGVQLTLNFNQMLGLPFYHLMVIRP